MDLKQYEAAQQTVKDYKETRETLAHLRNRQGYPNYLGVTFQSRYQEADVVDAARTGIIRYLEDKLYKAKLALIGVGIYPEDEDPAPVPEPAPDTLS